MAAAHSRVIVACGPSVPDALRGRPTTSSVTSFLATTSAIAVASASRSGPASDRGERSRGGAVVVGDGETDASFPEIDAEQSGHGVVAEGDGTNGFDADGPPDDEGSRDGDGEGDRAAPAPAPAPSTVTVTRLPNDGIVPIQSGHTETSTVPNGARMDRASFTDFPRIIAFNASASRIAICSADAVTGNRTV